MREVSETGELNNVVFEHFHDQFQAGGTMPLMDNCSFSQISMEANKKLIDRFSKDEIKNSVWDCDCDSQ